MLANPWATAQGPPGLRCTLTFANDVVTATESQIVLGSASSRRLGRLGDRFQGPGAAGRASLALTSRCFIIQRGGRLWAGGRSLGGAVAEEVRPGLARARWGADQRAALRAPIWNPHTLDKNDDFCIYSYIQVYTFIICIYSYIRVYTRLSKKTYCI